MQKELISILPRQKKFLKSKMTVMMFDELTYKYEKRVFVSALKKAWIKNESRIKQIIRRFNYVLLKNEHDYLM